MSMYDYSDTACPCCGANWWKARYVHNQLAGEIKVMRCLNCDYSEVRYTREQLCILDDLSEHPENYPPDKYDLCEADLKRYERAVKPYRLVYSDGRELHTARYATESEARRAVEENGWTMRTLSRESKDGYDVIYDREGRYRHGRE